jgi:2-keto-4-pentenoate hydratase/2-oxohepta-3-ene-1,7-dioic acid hydratase in catechol pathway
MQTAPGAVNDDIPLSRLMPPRNIMCLGTNYRDHVAEYAEYLRAGEANPQAPMYTKPEAPIIFTKPPSSLCGPRDDIIVDLDVTGQLDYEVELAVVIGTGGYKIAPPNAGQHIAGYTVLNDVTARDLQRLHRQWFLGKSLPRATPIGPVIVPRDQFTHLEAKAIKCWVNGSLRQNALLGDMIFSVEEAVSTISHIFPLLKGDIIAMGTPSGVGFGFNPPQFLADGDRVVCEIEGIGRLDNVVRFVSVKAAGRD